MNLELISLHELLTSSSHYWTVLKATNNFVRSKKKKILSSRFFKLLGKIYKNKFEEKNVFIPLIQNCVMLLTQLVDKLDSDNRENQICVCKVTVEGF